jgi:hypothetical protein
MMEIYMKRLRLAHAAIVAASMAFFLLAATPAAMAATKRHVVVVGWHKCGTFQGDVSWHGWQYTLGFPISHLHNPSIQLQGVLSSRCRGSTSVWLSFFALYNQNYLEGNVAGPLARTTIDKAHRETLSPASIAVAVCTKPIKPKGWHCVTDYI